MKITLIPGMVILLFFLQCGQSELQENKMNKKSKSDSVRSAPKNTIRFISPGIQSKWRFQESIPVDINISGKPTADSVIFKINGNIYRTVTNNEFRHSVQTDSMTAGYNTLAAKSYKQGNITASTAVQFLVIPKNPPVQYTYTIVNTYPHDKNAYTQGLIYENDYFYESTGLYGKSSLRKVDKTSGKPLQMHRLPNDIFGEGITLYNGKIIQLTYKAQKAFIYQKKDFREIQQIYYPNREGWGITFNGKHFIMSDGSHQLFYYDTSGFTFIKKIPVWDHTHRINRLNELEYINGSVFANVYGENYIVEINPHTGKVMSKIDLNGLLKPSDQHPDINVLNGIAYNEKSKTFFITGKNWPKLFEIRLIKEK